MPSAPIREYIGRNFFNQSSSLPSVSHGLWCCLVSVCVRSSILCIGVWYMVVKVVYTLNFQISTLDTYWGSLSGMSDLKIDMSLLDIGIVNTVCCISYQYSSCFRSELHNRNMRIVPERNLIFKHPNKMCVCTKTVMFVRRPKMKRDA